MRTMQTKRGDRMAFVAVEDRTGRQEIAVFADLYDESITTGSFVLIDDATKHTVAAGMIRHAYA
mgnify:CR=1 FL=1